MAPPHQFPPYTITQTPPPARDPLLADYRSQSIDEAPCPGLVILIFAWKGVVKDSGTWYRPADY